jgi:PEP-CTERM motif
VISSTKLFAALVIVPALSLPAQAGILLSEDFDNITTLSGSGWVAINNSAPLGTSGWFQGVPAIFSSQAGALPAYIASNFDAADFGGNISNWLLLPTMTLQNGDVFSFYTRTESLQVAADRLEVRLSTSGSSTNVGATSSVGDFTTLLLTVNPSLSTNGYPGQWTQFSMTLSGLGGSVTGRLALRYSVSDTSVNGDFIGIDTVLLMDPAPEPGTAGLALAALAGFAFSLRVRRK